MAKTRQQKEEIIKKIAELLKTMKSLVFIDYYGLKVKEINNLKKILKEKNSQYLVTKKTLLKLALKNAGIENINLDALAGGIGLVWSPMDEVEPARLIVKFKKEHEKMKIQGGIFSARGGSALGGDLEFIGSDKIEFLAKLPSKEQLIGQVVGLLKAPLSGLVYTLQGNLNKLVYILSQIKH